MKAARHGLITGLLPQMLEDGIISLQYADDTLLFLENNLEKACNLKWLLVCFEQMSGMNINYDKSDLLTVYFEENQANEFARLFCCKKVNFLLSTWGFPFIIIS